MTEIIQPAFVLHTRPYRETSLLVTFFTPEFGKLNAILKGVRAKSKSAQAKQAWLQPFQALQVRWKERSVSASDLVTMTHFEPLHLSFTLSGAANVCGLYCNELLYRLLGQKVSAPMLYEKYRHTLLGLSRSQMLSDKKQAANDQAWCLRLFEFALLNELGCAFQTHVDAFGEPISSEQDYQFYIEQGAVPISCLGAVVEGGVAISGQCLLAFSKGEDCAACSAQLKRLFRRVLSHYLGHRPIMARALFQSF